MSEFAVDSGHLSYRVAGVCIHDGHVLLHSEEQDDFWVIPGGRPLAFEASRDTLVREMQEEISTTVEVRRLIWVVENFFEYLGKRWHEISFYYLMSLPENSPYRDVTLDFTGKEGEITLLFRWFPIDQIDEIRLKPTFLNTALKAVPEFPVHVVHVDAPEEPGTDTGFG